MTIPNINAMFFTVFCASLLIGCDRGQPPLVYGTSDWKPKGIGGKVVARPLPPALSVLADFQDWRAAESSTNARVYEITLFASNQHNLRIQSVVGDTPMGQSKETWATFIYKLPEMGSYEMFFDRRGTHQLGFLKLDAPRTVWLKPIGQTNEHGEPKLKIVAFEGVKPDWGIVAEPGNN